MTKGLAIILMVMVHARFSHYGDTFINMFHMPLFFFMSGYCFKEAYLDAAGNYFKKRVKGAWWPYVKWGIFFLLLHNVFYALNIYNGEFGFRGEVSELYGLTDFFKKTTLIFFTMNGVDQLLGGYWFLHSYFIAAIISFVTISVFHKKLNYVVVGGGILLLLSVCLLYTGLRIPYYIEGRELLASAFMLTGYVYKRSHFHIEDYTFVVIPLCFFMLVIGTLCWPCSMLSLTWQKTIPYFVTAIAGTMMVFSICKKISKIPLISKVLVYVGDRTIDILTWHFLSFKIVSYLIILISSLKITHLAEFPVIEEYAYNGWWILYLAVGVVVPLGIEFLMSKIHNYIRKLNKTRL